MRYIKYLLILIILFILGLGLLGFFNKGVEIEVEEGIIAPVRDTWDAYIDTTSWAEWKTEGQKLEWKNGRKAQEGTTYRVIGTERTFQETITRSVNDSLLVLNAEYNDGAVRQSEISFSIENGQTMVKEKHVWTPKDFMQNVTLNFDRASIEKNYENKLKALKKLVEGE